MKEKPSRKNFRQRLNFVIDSLRNDIVSGKYKPGDFLPSEEALSQHYSLSNKSLRKGLEVLVEEGLLEKIPRVGNRITEAALSLKTTLKLACRSSLIREAGLNTLLAKFHECYPNIEVQTIILDHQNYYEATKTLLEAGLVDMIMLNYPDFQVFEEKGKLNLFKTIQAREDIYPFLNDAFTVNNKLLVQPFTFSPVILCYNRNHLQEMNIHEPDSSWDWHTLMKHADQLSQANDRYGFYFNMLSENRWSVFLLQHLFKFNSAEGKYEYSREKLKEALTLCRDLIYNKEIIPKYVAERELEVLELFAEEKVSMIMTTYFALNMLDEIDFPYNIAPLPSLGNPATLLLPIGWAINRQSEESKAAQLLVDFLSSKTAQDLLHNKTLSLPAYRSAEVGEDVANRPDRFFMYKEIMPSFKTFSHINLPQTLIKEISKQLKFYWFQMEDIEQAIARIDAILNKKVLK